MECSEDGSPKRRGVGDHNSTALLYVTHRSVAPLAAGHAEPGNRFRHETSREPGNHRAAARDRLLYRRSFSDG
jgi:hypothetical protein